MAGTDHRRESLAGGPVIVLVRPQLGENIGAAARAMMNFGLGELRLVAPRDPFPNRQATAMASGATAILDAARLFATTEEAVADLHLVLATTARERAIRKHANDPAEAAAKLRGAIAGGARAGILFGPERAGLANEDIALAREIVAIPANPAFASLNLAQAVLILGYEWHRGEAPAAPPAAEPPASTAELVGFFEHLEGALDRAGFLKPPEKRPSMVQNLRALFQRAALSGQEVRTLRGVVSAFERLAGREPGVD
ncbi:MAG: RNA methyltransferase [Alphaproteobacteria bacterium]|nr:RNA methyltransferase [Alphaproteobacteria bacterium]